MKVEVVQTAEGSAYVFVVSLLVMIIYVAQLYYSALFLLPAYVLLDVAVFSIMIKVLGALDERDIHALTAISPENLRGPLYLIRKICKSGVRGCACIR